MKSRLIKIILLALVFLSLIPASVLLYRRIKSEGHKRVITFVMDEIALESQADYYGKSSFDLAQEYRKLGLNGIAIYEETLTSLADKGDILLMTGSQMLNYAVSNDLPLPDIDTDTVLASELRQGALSHAIAKNRPKAKKIVLDGREWYVFTGSSTARPAGPRDTDIKRWSKAGYDIAYRPRNFPNLANPSADWPKEAHYIIYHGLQIAGYPNELSGVLASSQDKITGIIEGVPQYGMSSLLNKTATARILSFNQDYINQKLSPQDLIDKYLLAANERGISIMYLRPYIEEQQGDMLANSKKYIEGLRKSFENEGFEVSALNKLELSYKTSPLLRALSSVGIIAAVLLLTFLYPGFWGVLVTLAVVALGLLLGKLDWAALALMAAVTFPVLGYGYLKDNLSSLGLATLISLSGVVLLSAVGSDRESMLAISPFAGVGATLVIPPALFLFHYLLKYNKPAKLITDIWNQPIRVSHLAIAFVGLLAMAFIVMRRGNFPLVSASKYELAFRAWLAHLFVRPRFKELFGHTIAVVGLTNGSWPAWIKGITLTAGVIAQGTIMNSFSHYHTPFVISLERTLIALLIGLVMGLVLSAISRLLTSITSKWLKSAK